MKYKVDKQTKRTEDFMKENLIKRKIGIDPQDLVKDQIYYVVDLTRSKVERKLFISRNLTRFREVRFEFINMKDRASEAFKDRRCNPYRYYFFEDAIQARSYLKNKIHSQIEAHQQAITKLLSKLKDL